MKKLKIWCLGDAVIDLLPLQNDTYQACPGGAPANVAIGIAKLGNPSGFIGRVGLDPFGNLMKKTFESYHVDCQSLEFDNEVKTSTVLVDLALSGERSFTFLVSPSADQFVSQKALPKFDSDLLHFCSLALVGLTCRETLDVAIAQLKAKKGMISFDINLREQMWADKNEMRQVIHEFATKADILKLSDDELYWLTNTSDLNKAIDNLVANYEASLKIITKGAKGSIVIWHGKIFDYSSYKVDCIDTTGAGDAFVAGLLSSIAMLEFPKDIDAVDQMISHASACGAMATTKKGALTALPTHDFLEEFISKNSLLKAKNYQS